MLSQPVLVMEVATVVGKTLPVGIYELGHYGAQPYLESVFLARLAPVKEGVWATRQIP